MTDINFNLNNTEMKNSKYKYYLTFVALFSLSLISCDDFEPTVFNGDNTNNQSLVGFASAQLNLAVPIDSESELEVTVNVSTISDTDREYQISIVEPEEDAENIAFPETYNLPNTVTIPAGEYQGIFTIEGFDLGLVEPQARTFEIMLSSSNNNDVFSVQSATVSVFEVCPVPPDFLIGEYQIADDVATVGPNNGTENFAAETITITQGETETDRVFVAGILPAFAGDIEITLSLVCNEFVLRDVPVGLTCDGETSYIFTSAANGNNSNAVYDAENEQTTYTIFYTEDPNGSCGGPFLSSFSLTKI
jgi:hypothetical protein